MLNIKPKNKLKQTEIILYMKRAAFFLNPHPLSLSLTVFFFLIYIIQI